VKVDLKDGEGRIRSIYREVSAGSGYGGNSFVQHIGLDRAEQAEAITVTWPAGRRQQVFRQVPADRTVVVTEGTSSYQTRPRRPAASERSSRSGSAIGRQ
jgi:hypothetical protein